MFSRKDNDLHYERFGGNNVTYINDLFAKILPTLKQHILQTAQRSITQSAWKHKPSPSTYGIRSAYLLSTSRPGIELFLEMVRDKSERSWSSNWKKKEIIPPAVDPIIYHQYYSILKMNMTEELEYRQRFISDHAGSDMTIVVMLTETKHSCRGDYLHRISDDDLIISAALQSEYDDEEDEGKDDKHDNSSKETKITVIDNFMPEKGSILTLRGRYHGPEEAICGQRQVLVLELWKFQDAPLPEKLGEVMSEEEGAMLGLAEDEEVNLDQNNAKIEL